MIYDISQTIREDISVLKHWIKKEPIPNVKPEDVNYRTQIAAVRMFSAIMMTFGLFWTASILACVVTIPVKGAVYLTLAFLIYSVSHDVFRICQNVADPAFHKGVGLFGLFRGKEMNDVVRARQFAQGTLLEPLWMWLYVHRNDAKLKNIPLPAAVANPVGV